MKKILALALALVMVLALAACGGSKTETAEAPAAAPAAAPDAAAPVAGGATWADYQAYLIEKAGANAPDLDEFKAQVYAIGSWEEIDQTVSPWDQMFTTIGLSTWEEFQAGNVKEPAVMGGPDASASGEMAADAGAASGEPSGEASGEASDEAGEPPASGTMANSAHGGTPGATSQADYQAYLKAWVDAEHTVNSTMTDEAVTEFYAAIDAMNFSEKPGDMLFMNMLVTGSAMTYDEFVAANGVY